MRVLFCGENIGVKWKGCNRFRAQHSIEFTLPYCLLRISFCSCCSKTNSSSIAFSRLFSCCRVTSRHTNKRESLPPVAKIRGNSSVPCLLLLRPECVVSGLTLSASLSCSSSSSSLSSPPSTPFLFRPWRRFDKCASGGTASAQILSVC